MQPPRPYLSCVAAAFVVFQLATFAAAPIMFSAETLSEADAGKICTCLSAEPDAACPMHHGHGNSEQSRQDCKLQNSCAATDLAMLLLTAGGVGIVPTQGAAPIDQFAAVVRVVLLSALSRVEFPESPPPRS